MPKLTDESILEQGTKFKGQKLANVPGSYLLWLYRTFKWVHPDLKAYIEENMSILSTEAEKEKQENAKYLYPR